MRRLYTFVVCGLICLVSLAATAQGAQAAGFLKFNQSTYTVAAGNTIQVQVIVDPGTDQIAGTDAYVTYDPSKLQAMTVTAGTYFPSVSNNIASGKVSIWGVTEPASPKSGVGTIATVTFRALTNATDTLQYFCNASASNSSKIVKSDINATNIIDCTLNQTASVSISGSSGSGTVPTPTPATGTGATPTPGQLPQSGGFDNLGPMGMGGAVFLIAGAVIRLFFLR